MLKGVGRSPEAKPPSPLTLQPTPVHFPQCFAPGSPPSHCQQCQPHCPQHCPSASPRIVPGLGVAFPALSPGRLAHSKQSSLRAYPQLCDQQSLVPRTPFPTVSAGTLRLALCGPAPGTSWARCMLRGLALLGPGRCLWHFLGSKKGPQPTWPSCPDLRRCGLAPASAQGLKPAWARGPKPLDFTRGAQWEAPPLRGFPRPGVAVSSRRGGRLGQVGLQP